MPRKCFYFRGKAIHCEGEAEEDVLSEQQSRVTQDEKQKERKQQTSEGLTEKMLVKIEASDAVASRTLPPPTTPLPVPEALTQYVPEDSTFEAVDLDWVLMPDFLALRFTPSFLQDGVDQVVNHG